MEKAAIIIQLKKNHLAFVETIRQLNQEDFLFTENGKWTAGQQAAHILRSIKPVNFALGLPQFLLPLFFGKANRPSRSYDALLIKYKAKLAAGGRASGRFVPPPVAFAAKEKICAAILTVNNDLCSKINRCNEESLDTYILPHPLLGKLTLREMLYFNILHAEHHMNSVLQLLKKNV